MREIRHIAIYEGDKKTLMLSSNVAREKYKGKHNFVLLRGACSSHILKFRLEGKYE